MRFLVETPGTRANFVSQVTTSSTLNCDKGVVPSSFNQLRSHPPMKTPKACVMLGPRLLESQFRLILVNGKA